VILSIFTGILLRGCCNTASVSMFHIGIYMRSSNSRLLFLDRLRAIAIIMVVCVHTFAYTAELSEHTLSILKFIVLTIAVPIFFMVDGFLLSQNQKKIASITYMSYIKFSATRLVVPWVAFTVAYTLLRYLSEQYNIVNNNLIIGESFTEVVVNSYAAVYSSQLYFLLSLFFIRLLSPLILLIAGAKKIYVSAITFVFYLILYSLIKTDINYILHVEGGQEPLLHAFWGLQFYLFGVVANRLYVEGGLENALPLLSLLFMVLIIVFLKIESIFMNIVIQYSYLAWLFVLCFKLEAVLSAFQMIGENTMGIYLLHVPIVLNGVALVVSGIMISPEINFLLIASITTLLSLVITLVIRKVPYAHFLFGERERKSTAECKL